MRSKISIVDYLYFLSAKYEVDFDRLCKGLVLARENNEVSCGKLVIQCRKRTRKHDVFLITKGYKVAAQFFIPKHFLDNPEQIKEPNYNHFFRRTSDQDTHKNPTQIRDLRYGMKRINLRARVIDIPKPTVVFTRFGEYAYVSNALIADETGAIKLCLWNERIRAVSVDSVIQIENASVAKFRGENQLKLGKNGRLSIIENSGFPTAKEIEKCFLKSAV